MNRGVNVLRRQFIFWQLRTQKRLASALPRALASWEWSLQDLVVTELTKWTTSRGRGYGAGVPGYGCEAHAMVVPCMIDHLGFAHEASAVPLMLQVRLESI